MFYCFFEIHSIEGELDRRDFVKERAEVVLLGAKPLHYLFLSGLGTNWGHTNWRTSFVTGGEELGELKKCV